MCVGGNGGARESPVPFLLAFCDWLSQGKERGGGGTAGVSQPVTGFLDSSAAPAELLEICELSQEKMGSVFGDSNVYMLHMMYQAMGVCLFMQDWEGALRYGQKIIRPYR